MVALLGASPGVPLRHLSPSVCYRSASAAELPEAAWLPELKEIISTYGIELKQDGDACRRIRAETASVLKLLIRLNGALSAARSGEYTARTVAELMTDILRATGVLLPLRKGFPTTG